MEPTFYEVLIRDFEIELANPSNESKMKPLFFIINPELVLRTWKSTSGQ